jgi:hypothetical protein
MNSRRFDELISYLPIDDIRELNDDIIEKIIEVNEALYVTDSTISSAIDKISRYPISNIEILVNGASEYSANTINEIVSEIRNIIEKIRLKEILIRMGVDYYIYGSAFVSFEPIGNKYFVCLKCKNIFIPESIRIEKDLIDAFKYDKEKDMVYLEQKCVSCSSEKLYFIDTASIDWLKLEQYLQNNITKTKNYDIFIKQWNYKELEIKTSGLIPYPVVYIKNEVLKNYIRATLEINDISLLRNIPIEYIKTYFNNYNLGIPHNKIGILRYPIPSGLNVKTLPPLGRAYRYTLLLLEFLGTILETARDTVPYKILYTPQDIEYPSVSSPIIGFEQRRNIIKNAFQEMTKDRKKWAYLPFQISEISVGGKAAAYWLINMIDLLRNSILDATNIPKALILSDGVNWSASIVAMRILENTLLNYVNDLNNFLKKLSDFINVFWIKEKGIKDLEILLVLEPFKRSDALQEIGLLAQILGPDKISVEPIIKNYYGLSLEEYLERVNREKNIISKYDIEESIIRELANLKLEEYLKEEAGYEVAGMEGQEGEQQEEGEEENDDKKKASLKKKKEKKRKLTLNQIRQQVNDLMEEIEKKPSIIKLLIKRIREEYDTETANKFIAVLIQKLMERKKKKKKELEKHIRKSKQLTRRPRSTE